MCLYLLFRIQIYRYIFICGYIIYTYIFYIVGATATHNVVTILEKKIKEEPPILFQKNNNNAYKFVAWFWVIKWFLHVTWFWIRVMAWKTKIE